MQIARPLRHRRSAYAAAARDLHLWLLDILAWLMTRVVLPRAWRLHFQDDIRHARSKIRLLIFLAMCSRMTFRIGGPVITRRPNGALGWRRRRTRLMHAFTRGIALRTPRDMRDALKDFDRTVTRALARLPRNGATHGAVVAVIAGTIVFGAAASAPACEAADTS